MTVVDALKKLYYKLGGLLGISSVNYYKGEQKC